MAKLFLFLGILKARLPLEFHSMLAQAAYEALAEDQSHWLLSEPHEAP